MTGRLAAGVLFAVLIALGACGDDGDEADVATATSIAPTTTSPPGATTTSIPRPCAVAPGAEFTLTLTDFAFAPQCVQLRAGQSLKVTNNGRVLHNLSVSGKIDVDIKPAAEHTAPALSKHLAPGDYELSCRFHASAGMKARLEIFSG